MSYDTLDFDDLATIFDYAIEREKDSILFYMALKDFVSPEIKDHINKIIIQEGKHIAMILTIKQSM